MSEVTPVPVSREQAVRELIVTLEATLRELLPGFTFPADGAAPPDHQRRLRAG